MVCPVAFSSPGWFSSCGWDEVKKKEKTGPAAKSPEKTPSIDEILDALKNISPEKCQRKEYFIRQDEWADLFYSVPETNKSKEKNLTNTIRRVEFSLNFQGKGMLFLYLTASLQDENKFNALGMEFLPEGRQEKIRLGWHVLASDYSTFNQCEIENTSVCQPFYAGEMLQISKKLLEKVASTEKGICPSVQ